MSTFGNGTKFKNEPVSSGIEGILNSMKNQSEMIRDAFEVEGQNSYGHLLNKIESLKSDSLCSSVPSLRNKADLCQLL